MNALSLIFFIISFSALSQAKTKALCLESGQKSPYIGAEYTVGADNTEVTITTQIPEEEVKTETLSGSYPELEIYEFTTDEGVKVAVIQSISVDLETLETTIRVLFCSVNS